MGTSLVVQPFASLTNRVPDTTPRLYINLEKPAGDVSMKRVPDIIGFVSNNDSSILSYCLTRSLFERIKNLVRNLCDYIKIMSDHELGRGHCKSR